MTQNIYRYVLLYVSKCLPANVCRGWDQGGAGDMYMCVLRGPRKGWGHVHVCVEGDQEGDGDMYMLLRFTGDPQQIK